MNIYYVYQYVREDQAPYYIGKGKGNRAWEPHKRKNGQNLKPRDRSRIQVIKEGLTEQEAWDLEESLILKHGKIKDGGILVNVSNGRSGGPTVTSESRMGKNNPRWGVKEDPAVTEQRLVAMIRTKNQDKIEIFKQAIELMNNGLSAYSTAKKLGISRGVCWQLNTRTHGVFRAFPELV